MKNKVPGWCFLFNKCEHLYWPLNFKKIAVYFGLLVMGIEHWASLLLGGCCQLYLLVTFYHWSIRNSNHVILGTNWDVGWHLPEVSWCTRPSCECFSKATEEVSPVIVSWILLFSFTFYGDASYELLNQLNWESIAIWWHFLQRSLH